MEVNNVFDFIRIINKKEDISDVKDWNLFLKKFTPFIINRVYSSDKYTLPFAEIVDTFNNLPKKIIFDFYYYGLPKINHFIKYNAKDAKEEEKIKLISEYYNVNMSIAKEYYSIMDKEELDRILELFKCINDNKNIKKQKKEKRKNEKI